MADRVKDQVRDHFEYKIDKLHRIADVVTFPLAPIDGAIHGIARGALNWLTDNHPKDRHTSPEKSTANKCLSPCYSPPHQGYCLSPPPQSNPVNCYAAPPPPEPNGYGGYPPPPPPPPYYGYPSQPGPSFSHYPPYSYYNSGGHTNTGNGNNSSGQKNDGTVKFANVGSS